MLQPLLKHSVFLPLSQGFVLFTSQQKTGHDRNNDKALSHHKSAQLVVHVFGLMFHPELSIVERASTMKVDTKFPSQVELDEPRGTNDRCLHFLNPQILGKSRR